jgi:starch phosphorylase
MQEYLASTHTWGARDAGVLWARPVPYFSAEFGLHESLPIYSGGLGILAGDHVKSASDLGIPLVGIGLYYSQGYFKQRLDMDGYQHEDYLDVDSRILVARVWKLAVGRNTVLLLDSDVEGNSPEDRTLTARLYGGDDRTRVRQELLLGVGGVRALKALGISPGVAHLNEGHSAFAGLELVRQRMLRERIDANEGIRRVSQQIVFTTHTPVPAGHDRFSSHAIEEHLGPLRDALGMGHEQLMALGRVNTSDVNETFCMTVLALKLSRRANAVSSLTGKCRARCGPGSTQARTRSGCRSGISRTASMSRAGWRRRCTRCSIAISDPTGHDGAPTRRAGTRSKEWTMASCGRRIRR